MHTKPGHAEAGAPTRQRWSTADVESRHAMAFWVDTICKSFLEIDIDSPARDRFHGQLDQSSLGPASLHIVEADSQRIQRTPARIARSRYAGYFLLQLRAGQIRFQQYGRQSSIEAGDTVLIDCSAPYWLEYADTTRSVVLRFPSDWLRSWLPAPENLAGRPLRAGAGWSQALGAALASLDTGRDEPLALPEGVVAEQVAALLALAAGPGQQALRGSEKLYQRVLGTLRDRCHETELTPAAVAAQHGLSRRYLHHLFARAGTTFGNELMRLRMHCAQRLLADRRYAALPIGDLAARCGFMDPSHFARRFRKAHGVAPSECRAAAARSGIGGC